MPSAGAIRAGKAFVELLADDKNLRAGLAKAQARLRMFANGVNAMGKLTAGFGTTITSALFGMTRAFASSVASVKDMADRIGIGADELSKLQFAAEQSGASAEELAGAFTHMGRAMLAALGKASADDLAELGDDAKGMAQTFKQLGISLAELETLTPKERFLRFADALSRIHDPSLRAALATKIFGRSAARLLPMVLGGRKGIEALGEELERLGGVVTPDMANQADALDDAFGRLRASVRGVVFAVGSALAPIVQELIDRFAGVASKVVAWLSANSGLIVSAFKLGAALTAAGAALVATGVALKVVATALGLVLSPFGVLTAAVVGAGVVLRQFGVTANDVVQWLTQNFGGLLTSVQATIGGIVAAMQRGDVIAAGKVLWAGLRVEFQRGAVFVVSTWSRLVNALGRIWHEATFAIASRWLETMTAIKEMVSIIETAIKTTFVKALRVAAFAMIELRRLTGELSDEGAALARFGFNIAIDLGLAELDAKGAKQLVALEDELSRAKGKLAEMQAQGAKGLGGFGADAIKNAEEELRRLEKARDDLLRRQAAAGGELRPFDPVELLRQRQQQGLAAFAGVAEQMRTSAIGTFSGLALGGLGADQPLDKIERHANAIKDDMKQIIRNQLRNAPRFV